MERDEIISVLQSHRPEPDIDLLVDLDPQARLGVFEYVGIVKFIQSLFSAPVDVANSMNLKAFERPAIEREAVYAF